MKNAHLHENNEGNQERFKKLLISQDSGGLRADCKNCFGLCCIALYFSASEGFPADKEAGTPCPNLLPDFRCGVYTDRKEKVLHGCSAFDCFGAGQKVAAVIYNGRDWRQYPEFAPQMLTVFLMMRQLHELLWYLAQALSFPAAQPIYGELLQAGCAVEQYTMLKPEEILGLNTEEIRIPVNALLLQTSEWVREDARKGLKKQGKQSKRIRRGADLMGADLRGTDFIGANLRSAYLIRADLSGMDLTGADFIGADFRDADIRGANLSGSIFLTQGQMNSALGNKDTKLPPFIQVPIRWANE